MSAEPMPGWLYRTSIWTHDQSYGWCVPVSTSRGWYMQDTYQLSHPSVHAGEKDSHEAAIRRAIELSDGEDHLWTIQHASGNHYHKAYAPFSERDFEPVCDLRLYERVNDREAEDYADEDKVRGVKLYFEHGYSWNYGARGVTLKRKGAQKDKHAVFAAEIKSVNNFQHFPHPYAEAEGLTRSRLVSKLPDDPTPLELAELDEALAIDEMLLRQKMELRELLSFHGKRVEAARKACEAE